MSAKQTNKLYAILDELGIRDQKSALVSQYTGGRTESAKEMEAQQMGKLITDLVKELDQQRKPWIKKIVAAMYRIAEYRTEWKTASGGLNYARALQKAGKEDVKSLSDFRLFELPGLYRQMQAIKRNYEQKRKNRNSA